METQKPNQTQKPNDDLGGLAAKPRVAPHTFSELGGVPPLVRTGGGGDGRPDMTHVCGRHSTVQHCADTMQVVKTTSQATT